MNNKENLKKVSELIETQNKYIRNCKPLENKIRGLDTIQIDWIKRRKL